ncbi:MoxR-like ATPase [Rubidibacter lacunae KORDI 51-2]|uniref:MoxR-like ATPase n=1 Tax=Rubidibacter lacunae KORDI 51-2 TaxID=582515 RepID=U5DMT6_9CHRO|nr:MoxR family ATPase [Rubidibacter lacunae]ERN41010.1 MoxR-like ATPase [Rubidibacter lacunae KORDI 51-2]
MRDRIQQLADNIGRVLVGKETSIRLVLSALLGGGHALLEDVPGVGKTLLAKSLARSIDGTFQRIQCTPDLLPSDITGTNIWNQNAGEFGFMPGPVFAHVLLADEINRATPRTQSALLEVMEERQVTLDGKTHKVPKPFFTIATQNPVEYQGTFPLPEAQMDRFALSLSLGYPTADEELRILQYQGEIASDDLEACITPEEVLALQAACLEVEVAISVQKYILNLVRASRADEEIALGVSPRGTVALQKVARAFAYIEGRNYVEPDDVKFLAPHVLAHRLIPNAGRNARAIVDRLLRSVAVED